MPIFDAHLDLAYNAMNGRDLSRPAAEQPPDADGAPAVSFPDLRAGGVNSLCATLYCAPKSDFDPDGYTTCDQARVRAKAQLAWYADQAAAGRIRIVKTAADLSPAPPKRPGAAPPINAILLMEGADPLDSDEDVKAWFDAGLRAVGLAWKRTRHAGGTAAPGPLTDSGRLLVAALERAGIIHDTSHLAEESFWELLELSRGPVMASHSNCRALIPTDRHLSDDMIRALAARGGVIGLNLFDKFLLPPGQLGQRRASLADLLAQVDHLAGLLGGFTQIGLGTDMDGGFGRDRLPQELHTIADLHLIADALSAAGRTDTEIANFMHGNWSSFFARSLPQ